MAEKPPTLATIDQRRSSLLGRQRMLQKVIILLAPATLVGDAYWMLSTVLQARATYSSTWLLVGPSSVSNVIFVGVIIAMLTLFLFLFYLHCQDDWEPELHSLEPISIACRTFIDTWSQANEYIGAYRLAVVEQGRNLIFAEFHAMKHWINGDSTIFDAYQLRAKFAT